MYENYFPLLVKMAEGLAKGCLYAIPEHYRRMDIDDGMGPETRLIDMDGTLWGRTTLLYVMDHCLGTDMSYEEPDVLRGVETILDVAVLAASRLSEDEEDDFPEELPFREDDPRKTFPLLYPLKPTDIVH
jgi:hypothetical protein